ncbi:MAG: hypothetical protein GXN96_06625 [Aquificae bacterium]|nr:hypothetical protein [Aquificota bacterium]
MRTLFLLLSLLLLGVAGAQVPEGLKEFFKRSGYVVEREGELVILDLPEGKVFVGERFGVFKKGKPIVHPITRERLGYREEKVGEVEVKKVYEKFSEAVILKDSGIEPGDSVRLLYGSVCFEGSDEAFYELSEVIEGLKREGNCDYTIRELEGGFGVSFRGKAIAFFPYGPVSPQVPQKRGLVFEDFGYKTRFLRALEDLPLGADLCRLFGSKEQMVVLFPGKLKIYEITGLDVAEYLTYNLPPGDPVGVVCWEDVVIVNMVVDGKASSVLLKSSADSLILGSKDVPYLFGRLGDTLVGQEFDDRNLWGRVYAFEYDGEELKRGEELSLPEGFRVDGALKFGDTLLFVDSERRLRVFVGEEEVLTEENFGLSYTAAEFPETYEYGEEKYIFHPRPALFRLYGQEIPLVVRNNPSGVFKLIGVTKFSEGELWSIVRKENFYEAVNLKGRKFRETIQAVLVTSEGRVFVITGSRGTIPIQNKGEVFLIEISPL